MHFDVVVVGGGTAGCVLASRLSENPDRRVCLLEAGPDYGPLGDGQWPDEILDGTALPPTHGWESDEPNVRTLGGMLVGGSSAINAAAISIGDPADYDAWGHGWSYDELVPCFERAREAFRVGPAFTTHPAPFHVAFLQAAQAAGYPPLDDPNDPVYPVGVAAWPTNVVAGRRWNAALAYLEAARARENLVVLGDELVDRVLFDGARAHGVVTADGDRFDADTVIVSAGAYFSPTILLRSGIGRADELTRHGLAVLADLPVGEPLLDHHGVGVAWEPTDSLQGLTETHLETADLYEPYVLLKAASSACPRGSWDLHVLTWLSRSDTGRFEPSVALFHMQPRSTGRVELRSTDAADSPVVDHGFLADEADAEVLVEGIEIVRSIAATEPLHELLDVEVRPGPVGPEEYLRTAVRNYFHPSGTCAIGRVLDSQCRVLGVEGLLVVDASVMPTIPRAGTNLTTAAIAERVATFLE